MTGWVNTSLANMGGRPSIGSPCPDCKVRSIFGAAVRRLGRSDNARPWSDAGQVGFLGPRRAVQAGRPRHGKPDAQRHDAGQFSDRQRLLASFDGLRRDVDASGVIEGMDALSTRLSAC